MDIIYRDLGERDWKMFSEMFAKDDPIGKLINECQMIKDLDLKEGNFSFGRRIQCDKDTALNATEE